MSQNIRFVWYSPSGSLDILGTVDVQPDGSFTGQVDDKRVKRMLEAGLFLDLGFSARSNVPATRKDDEGSKNQMPAFTTHGHEIPDSVENHQQPDAVARCGGPGICLPCSKEAARWVIPERSDDWTVSLTRARPKTLTIASEALMEAGLSSTQSWSCIARILSQGILFQEKMP